MGFGGAAATDYVPPMIVGRYYRLPNCVLQNVGTLGNGTLRLTPKYVPHPIRLDRLGCEIVTAGEAGSKVRLGIYSDDGAFRPGALFLDAGTINGDSATVQELTVSVSIPAGWHWFGGAVQVAPTTQPVVRATSAPAEITPTDYGSIVLTSNQSGRGHSMSNVTGALPSAFVFAGAAGSGPALFGRVAA